MTTKADWVVPDQGQIFIRGQWWQLALSMGADWDVCQESDTNTTYALYISAEIYIGGPFSLKQQL